jgi:hypothetical protein
MSEMFNRKIRIGRVDAETELRLDLIALALLIQ